MDLEQRLRKGPLRVRDVWSAEQTAALSGRVVRLRRQRSLLRGAAGLGVLACASLVIVLSLREPAPADKPRELARVAPAAAPSAEPEPQRTLVLHDGSRAEPLDAESRFSVTRDDPDHMRVALQRGGARFAVTPRARRRFEVDAGPVLVRVKGTTFSVKRTETTTQVMVEDGHVQVLWAGERADLHAGDTGVFPPPEEEVERPESASAPAWRDLAKRGEYKRAYSALQKTRARLPDQPEDHMLAADVARLSGHPQYAVPHLRAVSERFGDDPRAPVAAFTLGRVLLDLERPRDAALAFRRARTLWPRGPLALDAWAGEAEALREAGDERAAAQLAQRYVERHPKGRHAAAMRALAARD